MVSSKAFCIEKAKSLLKYYPKISFEEGIKKTVSFIVYLKE